MAFKVLVCPNCGGLIETFDETTKKGFCPYCDTIIVDVGERQADYELNSQGAVKVTLSDFDIQGGVLVRYCGESPSVIVPGNVSIIGGGAFTRMRGITSVTLPEGVKEIQERAFMGCISLRSATLPESLEQIGERAFEGCSSLESLELPSKAPLSIGGAAFRGCGIETIKLPKGVKLDRLDERYYADNEAFDVYPRTSSGGVYRGSQPLIRRAHNNGWRYYLNDEPLIRSRVRKVVVADLSELERLRGRLGWEAFDRTVGSLKSFAKDQNRQADRDELESWDFKRSRERRKWYAQRAEECRARAKAASETAKYIPREFGSYFPNLTF